MAVTWLSKKTKNRWSIQIEKRHQHRKINSMKCLTSATLLLIERRMKAKVYISFLFAFVWVCEGQCGDRYMIDSTTSNPAYCRWWVKLFNIANATTSLFVFSWTVAEERRDYCNIHLLYIKTCVEGLVSRLKAPAEGPFHCMACLISL